MSKDKTLSSIHATGNFSSSHSIAHASNNAGASKGIQTSKSSSYDGSESSVAKQPTSTPQTSTVPIASASKQGITSQQTSGIQTNSGASTQGSSGQISRPITPNSTPNGNSPSSPIQTSRPSTVQANTVNTNSPTRNIQTATAPIASAAAKSITNQQISGIRTSEAGAKANPSQTSETARTTSIMTNPISQTTQQTAQPTQPTNVANSGYTIANKVATMTNQTLILSGVSNVTESAKRALSSYQNKTLTNSELVNGGRAIIGKIESAVMGSDDLGMQTIGGAYEGVRLSASAMKVSQTIVDTTPQIAKAGANGVAVVGKGVYQVGLQAGLTTVAVTQAYGIAKGLQVMPMSTDAMRIFKSTAIANGLNQTAISKQVIQTATTIQTGLVHGISAVKSVVPNTILMGQRIKSGVIQTATVTANTAKMAYATVKGVANGTLSVSFVAYRLELLAKAKLGKAIMSATPLIKTGLGTAVRGTAVGAKWFATKGMPSGIKNLRGGIATLAGAFGAVDDYAIQGVVNTIQTADIASRLGVKTVQTGFTLGKNVTKTGIKTIETLSHGAVFWTNFVKANGVRRMLAEAGHRAGASVVKAVASAGSSVVSAIINLAKMLGKKFLIPLLLIVFIASGGISALSAPVMAVGSIFSGIFSTSDTEEEFEVQAFLSNPSYGIPTLTTATKQDIANDMSNDWKSAGGAYDIVRLLNPDGTGAVVAPTLDGVSSIFYTDVEIVQLLEPIFNSEILMNYDLEPTLQEAKDVLNDMYSKIFTVNTVPTTEYCGQSISDGTGTARTAHSCGSIHAITSGTETCPTQITGSHGSWSCSDCCYYDCHGHQHSSGSHADGTYSEWTTYCSGCHHECNSYFYCGGHAVNSYVISLDGLYPLIYEIFLEPIDTLSNMASRTDEQEEQLQNLKDYYEIFQIMMTQVAGGAYGGGLSVDDLSGIQWVASTRTGNNDVVNLAKSQATSASVGGALYWSYYGFRSRVEWCACFVHWCMKNTASASGAYPTTSNNAYCQTVADNFRSLGQFKSSSEYGNLTAGDVIFFDWQSDGHTDHVGIVIGRDNEYVYTVEGNSGDAVKIKKYNLSSSVIYGYAFMNY